MNVSTHTARIERILPVHYFHLVFTIPSELHSLARNNRAKIFALLSKSAADTLLTLAADPKWLGKDAQLGITAVLHTWTREMLFHLHVHCIVTGGGLACDQSQWVPAPRDFLFPVHVVGALFRGKFMAGLQELLDEGELHDDVTDRAARRRRQRLYKTSWVVFAKRPFGGPEQVVRYLGRYTHRVAISNARLVSVEDQAVVFRTRGSDTASLSPTEFIGRFLQHVLPNQFVKIRHFGLMASGSVNTRLKLAAALVPAAANAAADGQDDGHDDDDGLPSVGAVDPNLPWPELLLALTGTIRDPRLLEGGELMLFDRVIANPPFSLDDWGREVAERDPLGRFRFGTPPKTKGDLAFVQHMIAAAPSGPRWAPSCPTMKSGRRG